MLLQTLSNSILDSSRDSSGGRRGTTYHPESGYAEEPGKALEGVGSGILPWENKMSGRRYDPIWPAVVTLQISLSKRRVCVLGQDQRAAMGYVLGQGQGAGRGCVLGQGQGAEGGLSWARDRANK